MPLHVMLFLQYLMLQYVRFHYVIPCYTMLGCVIWCCIMLCNVILCATLNYYTISDIYIYIYLYVYIYIYIYETQHAMSRYNVLRYCISYYFIICYHCSTCYYVLW